LGNSLPDKGGQAESRLVDIDSKIRVQHDAVTGLA
jgi:hypothetical protein